MGIRANMLWQDAWIMAIALAWSDDALREELKSDPAAFFKQHCNFNVPESLTIEVLDSPDADSQGVAPGWDPETGIWYLRNTVVQMYLPPPPPVEQQAIAMSAYVATGRTYPFTVC